MGRSQDFDVAVIGHFSIDSISLPNRNKPFVVLGGAAAYVSFIVRRLDGSVFVVSKIGVDFPSAYLWWLKQEGIDVSGVIRSEHACTTSFQLEYSSDLSSRNLRLKNRAPQIVVADLPNSLHAQAVHIAPIAGEIPCETVEQLKGCAQVISLDPQGSLRSFDESGNVSYSPLPDKRLLDLVDIYKSSFEEITILTGLSDLNSAIRAVHDYGVETVIVTSGAKGAVLSVEKTLYKVPAYKLGKFIDPTGAGDVFMGGFLTEYVRGKDSLWCGCVGSAAASLVVESVGPTFLGEREEIYRRARWLYEKELKG
ncbi:MAG: carbohydrate kinase family protein [Candidatus Bathycorpusculaceae bacterium]